MKKLKVRVAQGQTKFCTQRKGQYEQAYGKNCGGYGRFKGRRRRHCEESGRRGCGCGRYAPKDAIHPEFASISLERVT
jgi:hypothetical protein